MLIGAAKTKSGTCDGYFDKKFIRAFDGEAPKKSSKVNREKSPHGGNTTENRKPFLPTGGPKKP